MVDPLNINTAEFHRYAFSNFLDNVVRGSLGEYIVALALGITDDTPLNSWESWDISYQDLKIEVKTSAYVQTWYQKKKSTPRYGIQKREGYVGNTGDLDGIKARQANVYVFCLFTYEDYHDKEGAQKAIVNLESWQFYVVPTNKLPEEQETIGLWSLSQITEPISFEQLSNAIKAF